MNTIEFAVQDGVPYAINYLNPAPDFERDRITDFYFGHVVDKMSALVIDRALQRSIRRSPGRGGRRCSGSVRVRIRRCPWQRAKSLMDAHPTWQPLLRPDVGAQPPIWRGIRRDDARAEADLRRSRALSVPQAVLSDGSGRTRMRVAAETIAALGERVTAAALESRALFDQLGDDRHGSATRADRPGYAMREHRVASGRVPAARHPSFR